MRLATYSRGSGNKRVGLIENGSLVDVPDAPTMLELIRSGKPPRPSSERVALDSVKLHAPIPRPDSDIICIGRNYREHVQEMARSGLDAQEKPTFFSKAVTSVIGPTDPIPYDPSLTTELDWEVELGVIIGREARHVPADEALGYVYGYTVVNDVSARDLQYGYGGQFFYGKSLDGSCPLGPWIVTADEIPDPQVLRLRLRLNGEIMQESSTDLMIFGVVDMIERLSRAMTLLPGQIIATGTPPGVGHARTPPRYLQPGDVMESEIEGIGSLRNSVAQPEQR